SRTCMKVWLIRLSMAATVERGAVARFSEYALLPGRAHPRHRPAGWHPQCGIGREPRPVFRRRLSDDVTEGAAERAEAVETDVEADLGYGTVGLAQQLHGPLNPAALQVPVRGLAESGAE